MHRCRKDSAGRAGKKQESGARSQEESEGDEFLRLGTRNSGLGTGKSRAEDEEEIDAETR